jgi:hypothetical protein
MVIKMYDKVDRSVLVFFKDLFLYCSHTFFNLFLGFFVISIIYLLTEINYKIFLKYVHYERPCKSGYWSQSDSDSRLFDSRLFELNMLSKSFFTYESKYLSFLQNECIVKNKQANTMAIKMYDNIDRPFLVCFTLRFLTGLTLGLLQFLYGSTKEVRVRIFFKV